MANKILSSTYFENEESITKYIDMGSHKVATYLIKSETKSSEKPLVIFISGMADDHTSWTRDNIVDGLIKDHDVLLYDRGISGNSILLEEEDFVKNGRGVEQMSFELEKIIEEYCPENRKTVLVGHSLGGYIMRDFSLKNKNKIHSLLFVDPSHEDWFDNYWDQDIKNSELPSTISKMNENVNKWIEDTLSTIEDPKYNKYLRKKFIKDLKNLAINFKLELIEIENNSLYMKTLNEVSTDIPTTILSNPVPYDLDIHSLAKFKYNEFIQKNNEETAKRYAKNWAMGLSIEDMKKQASFAQKILNKGQKKICTKAKTITPFNIKCKGGYVMDEFPKRSDFHYIHQKIPNQFVEKFSSFANIKKIEKKTTNKIQPDN